MVQWPTKVKSVWTPVYRLSPNSEVSYRMLPFTILAVANADKLAFMVFKVSFSWVNAASYYWFFSWCMMCHLFKRTFWCSHAHELNLKSVLGVETESYRSRQQCSISQEVDFSKTKMIKFLKYEGIFQWTWLFPQNIFLKGSQLFAEEHIYRTFFYLMNSEWKLLSS